MLSSDDFELYTSLTITLTDEQAQGEYQKASNNCLYQASSVKPLKMLYNDKISLRENVTRIQQVLGLSEGAHSLFFQVASPLWVDVGDLCVDGRLDDALWHQWSDNSVSK